jgi:cytosine/adenosine deaminase-related metal-dependent hydrolase
MNKKSELKIYNAWICQIDNQIIRPIFGDVSIREGRIIECDIRTFPDFKTVRDDEGHLDAEGRVITVPLVNFHEHIYSRLAQGIPVKGPTTNFKQILENLWWELDRSLDENMIAACAEVATTQFIRNGVIYIFDHHSSPKFIKGSLSIIAEVLKRNQLRGVLCYETSNRNNGENSEQALKENSAFIRSEKSKNIKAMLGLHACFTLCDDTLAQARNIVRELSVPIHIHLSEDIADVNYCQKNYGLSPVERLLKHDLLDPGSLLIHGVHLDENDYKILAGKGCAIVYNPDSNLNNAVGLPDYASVPATIPILAGTDGMHANVHQSLKQLFLLYRMQKNSFDDTFQWLHKIYFDQVNYVKKWFPDFPSLHEGDRADLVVWDYIPATPFQSDNFWGHLIYGLTENRAHTVINGGNILMQKFQVYRSENSISSQSVFEQGKKMYDRMSGQ